MVCWSPYLPYKRLMAFSYPLLAGCSIQYLINSFTSSVVYLIRRVNLPRGSSLLLSNTSLKKVTYYLKCSRLSSKTFISTSGADCCFNNWQKHLKLQLSFFDYQMLGFLFLAHNCSCCLLISFDLHSAAEFLDGQGLVDIFGEVDHHKYLFLLLLTGLWSSSFSLNKLLICWLLIYHPKDIGPCFSFCHLLQFVSFQLWLFP